MTDRYNALVVTLDHDIRSDDCADLINAIKQFRHVIDVAGNVQGIEDHVAQIRAKSEVKMRLWEAFKELP